MTGTPASPAAPASPPGPASPSGLASPPGPASPSGLASPLAPASPPAPAPAAGRQSWRLTGVRTVGRPRSPIAAAGLGIVAALALVAVVAPLVLPGSPTAIASALALRGPTLGEPFGMDDLGRSVLSRVVHGYRISLGVAVASVALAILIGLPLGLLAGYAEGIVDHLVMRPLDILMAFPAILLAIALMSLFGTGVLLVSLALAIVYVPIVARVVRAAVLATKAEVYVEGARAAGATAGRLVLRHILPNCVTPLLVQASVLMAIAILVEAALSFLGVGVRPPTPSLGLMLSDGRGFMLQAPWVVVFPGLAILVAVLGFNMLADGLRDWLDPHHRAGR